MALAGAQSARRLGGATRTGLTAPVLAQVIEIKPGHLGTANSLFRLLQANHELLPACAVIMSFDVFAMHRVAAIAQVREKSIVPTLGRRVSDTPSPDTPLPTPLARSPTLRRAAGLSPLRRRPRRCPARPSTRHPRCLAPRGCMRSPRPGPPLRLPPWQWAPRCAVRPSARPLAPAPRRRGRCSCC